MRKLILILLMTITLSSCSWLPRITTSTPGTVPQSIQKDKSKDICKGEAKLNSAGDMVYCSSGYYAYSENYGKKEREYTFKEKIINIIRKLSFWGLIIVIGLFVFIPSTAGLLIGRFIEGTIGATGQVLRSVTRGVQRARKRGEDLDTALESEMDEKHKKVVRKIKDKEKIK